MRGWTISCYLKVGKRKLFESRFSEQKRRNLLYTSRKEVQTGTEGIILHWASVSDGTALPVAPLLPASVPGSVSSIGKDLPFGSFVSGFRSSLKKLCRQA